MGEEGEAAGLAVWGRRCLLLDSPVSDPEKSLLQLWGGSEERGLWIDKYDVRALCSDYSDFHTKKGAVIAHEEEEENDDSFEQEDLQYERYQNIFDVPECDLINIHDDTSDSFEDASGESRETPSLFYKYGEVIEEIADPFNKPPHNFPSNIHHFPETMKHFNIILHTAHTVRKEPQLEILLKVKQKGNPKFYFLEEDINSRCDLFPLYHYLKSMDDRDFWMLYLGKDFIESAPSSSKDDKIDSSRAGSALSLLGAYDDSDSENETLVQSTKLKCDTEDSHLTVVADSQSCSKDDSIESGASSPLIDRMNVDDDKSPSGKFVNISHDSAANGVVEITTKTLQSDHYQNEEIESDEGDMLDSDIDEKQGRFWMRNFHCKTKCDFDTKCLVLSNSSDVGNDSQNDAKKRSERLQRAKLLSDHFLKAASMTEESTYILKAAEYSDSSDACRGDRSDHEVAIKNNILVTQVSSKYRGDNINILGTNSFDSLDRDRDTDTDYSTYASASEQKKRRHITSPSQHENRAKRKCRRNRHQEGSSEEPVKHRHPCGSTLSTSPLGRDGSLSFVIDREAVMTKVRELLSL